MTVLIDDRYKDDALEALSTKLPKESYKIDPDPLREELQKRIDEIDRGEVEMIPSDEFWDRLDDRIEKHLKSTMSSF